MEKQLFAAASKGDLELVKNRLTQGADKEYIDVEVSQVIYFICALIIDIYIYCNCNIIRECLQLFNKSVQADESRNLTIRKDFAHLYRRVLSLLCM